MKKDYVPFVSEVEEFNDTFNKNAAFYLGLSYSMDCSRIIKHIRVIDNKICYLDKTYNHILEMYEVRSKLHLQIYKHHAVIALELMLGDIISNVEDILKIKDSILNPEDFCSYDDYLINLIEKLDLKSIDKSIDININKNIIKLSKAKDIINKIKTRKHYKLVELNNNNLIKYEYYLGYKDNPFENIYFYNKNNNNYHFRLNDNYLNTYTKKVNYYTKIIN